MFFLLLHVSFKVFPAWGQGDWNSAGADLVYFTIFLGHKSWYEVFMFPCHLSGEHRIDSRGTWLMAGYFCSWVRGAQWPGFGFWNILSHYLECPQIHKSATETTKQNLCIYGGLGRMEGVILRATTKFIWELCSQTEYKETKMPFVSGRRPQSASRLVTLNWKKLAQAAYLLALSDLGNRWKYDLFGLCYSTSAQCPL